MCLWACVCVFILLGIYWISWNLYVVIKVEKFRVTISPIFFQPPPYPNPHRHAGSCDIVWQVAECLGHIFLVLACPPLYDDLLKIAILRCWVSGFCCPPLKSVEFCFFQTKLPVDHFDPLEACSKASLDQVYWAFGGGGWGRPTSKAWPFWHVCRNAPGLQRVSPLAY